MLFIRPNIVLALSGVSAAAFIGASACKRDKDPEVAGYQQGQTQYPGAGAAGVGNPQQAPVGYGGQPLPGQPPLAAGGAPGTVPATPGTAPTPAPTTPAPAPTVPGAQALDPGAAAMVQPVINQLAKAHTVAGAKPLGSVLAGNFQTGQTLEAQIQLQPQKCYTVVATSLLPVTELNVQLVAATPIPNLAPVLATDSDTGPTAVIGKKPNCYKWLFPLPGPAKVVLQVAAGSGLAAAQVYEK